MIVYACVSIWSSLISQACTHYLLWHMHMLEANSHDYLMLNLWCPCDIVVIYISYVCVNVLLLGLALLRVLVTVLVWCPVIHCTNKCYGHVSTVSNTCLSSLSFLPPCLYLHATIFPVWTPPLCATCLVHVFEVTVTLYQHSYNLMRSSSLQGIQQRNCIMQ